MSILVIVESPSKAKTIKKYLGKGYEVKASVGHVRDLPKSNTKAIDIEGGFVPNYEISKDKTKVIAELKAAAKKAAPAKKAVTKTPAAKPVTKKAAKKPAAKKAAKAPAAKPATATAAPSAQTTLNPQAAWPFPTASKP